MMLLLWKMNIHGGPLIAVNLDSEKTYAESPKSILVKWKVYMNFIRARISFSKVNLDR